MVDVTVGAVKLATYVPGIVIIGWLNVPPADELKVRLAPEIGPVLFLTVTVTFDTLADLIKAGLAPMVALNGGMIIPKA
jgi:hypothetical protein